MPFKSSQYQPGFFRKAEQILPDQVIDGPVWCVEKAEVWRRKKTVFGTCPSCLKINRLDGRRVNEYGDFNGCGCFVCPYCRCPFWPHLKGWTTDARDIPKNPKRTKKAVGGENDINESRVAGPAPEAQSGSTNGT